MIIQYKIPHTSLDVGSSENSEMDQISYALNSKSKQIDEEFKVLKQKFLETAEQQISDLKQKDDILEEIERIRLMYQELKKENSNLKNKTELLNQKLESKTTLSEYLEEKCAKISTEKETDIIKLKSEILVLQKSLRKQIEKHSSEVDELNKARSLLERSNQELEEKYQKVINAQANFDSDFKKKVKENKKLHEEFKKHKRETKQLLEEKNLLIKEYEDRIKKLNELKVQQVEMVDKQREQLDNELGIVKNQLKILNLKESFYQNKAVNLIKQKEFLVKQIANNLETMSNEYNKLEDMEHQKDYMISVKKSNKNIQEVYFTVINHLKYFKEVIDYMNFGEFESVNTHYFGGSQKEEPEKEEQERPLEPISHTSLVSEIKEESIDEFDEKSKDLQKQSVVDNHKLSLNEGTKYSVPVKKQSKTSIINKIEMQTRKVRKHITSKELIMDAPLGKEEPEEIFSKTEAAQFRKDSEFYFTHYCQEVLNALMVIATTFYDGVGLEIPNSLILLEDIVRERSDNDLAAEILDLFGGREQIEILLKNSRENVEKLERQKASLLKELNDARKKISKLKKTEAEGDKSGDVSDSMSGNSSELKTPKSEDLATIERLKKQKKGLEEKLKETKKKNNDEKQELKEKIIDFENEIEEKNSKLQSLKDSLVDQFKIDITKLQKSFEAKEKLLEQRLLREKQSEIEKVTKKIESECQQQISSLSSALEESKQKLTSLTAASEENIKSELRKKSMNFQKAVKIYRENKATFCLAFASQPSEERGQQHILQFVAKALGIERRNLRLISVNYEERLENDRDTELYVYLYEVADDLRQIKVLSALNKLRTDIRSGTSILFDLNPVYVGVNIGLVHGFIYEKPIEDYYLLKREGVYFGERQLVVTLLKHPEHFYKVVAYDVSTNKEYTLSIDHFDIIELINSYRDPTVDYYSIPPLYETIENEDEVCEIIFHSLTLIKKEVQTHLLCQQRLYLSDYTLTSNPNPSPMSSIEASEDSEVRQINSQKSKCFSREEQTTQTSFEDNILHECYDGVLVDGPRRYLLGMYRVDVAIKRGYHSRRVLLEVNMVADKEVQVQIQHVLFNVGELEERAVEAFTK